MATNRPSIIVEAKVKGKLDNARQMTDQLNALSDAKGTNDRLQSRQALAEMEQLQRVIQQSKQNERPGHFKKLDAEGQLFLDSLQTKLQDIDKLTQDDLHAITREVTAKSELIGKNATKAITSQLGQIGQQIVQLERIKASDAALSRVKKQVEGALSGAEVTVKVTADTSDVKLAKAELSALEGQSQAAVKKARVVAKQAKAEADVQANRKQSARKKDTEVVEQVAKKVVERTVEDPAKAEDERRLRLRRNLAMVQARDEIKGKQRSVREQYAEAGRITGYQDHGQSPWSADQENVLRGYVATTAANRNALRGYERRVQGVHARYDDKVAAAPALREHFEAKRASEVAELDAERARTLSAQTNPLYRQQVRRDWRDATMGDTPRRFPATEWPASLQPRGWAERQALAKEAAANREREAALAHTEQRRALQESADRSAAAAARRRASLGRDSALRIVRPAAGRHVLTPETHGQLSYRSPVDFGTKAKAPSAFDQAYASGQPLRLSDFPVGTTFNTGHVEHVYEGATDETGTFEVPSRTDLTPAGQKSLRHAASVAVREGSKDISFKSSNTASSLYKYKPERLGRFADTVERPLELFQALMGTGAGTKADRGFTMEGVFQTLGIPLQYGTKAANFPVRTGTRLEDAIRANPEFVSNKPGFRLPKGEITLGGTVGPKGKLLSHDLTKFLAAYGNKYGHANAFGLLVDQVRPDNTVDPGGLDVRSMYPMLSGNALAQMHGDYTAMGLRPQRTNVETLKGMRHFERAPNNDEYGEDLKELKTHAAQQALLRARTQFTDRVGASGLSRAALDRSLIWQDVTASDETLAKRREAYASGAPLRGAAKGLIENLPYLDDLITSTFTPDEARRRAQTFGQTRIQVGKDRVPVSEAAAWDDKRSGALNPAQRRMVGEYRSGLSYASSGHLTEGSRAFFKGELTRDLLQQAVTPNRSYDVRLPPENVEVRARETAPPIFQPALTDIVRTAQQLENAKKQITAKVLKDARVAPSDKQDVIKARVNRLAERLNSQYAARRQTETVPLKLPSSGRLLGEDAAEPSTEAGSLNDGLVTHAKLSDYTNVMRRVAADARNLGQRAGLDIYEVRQFTDDKSLAQHYAQSGRRVMESVRAGRIKNTAAPRQFVGPAVRTRLERDLKLGTLLDNIDEGGYQDERERVRGMRGKKGAGAGQDADLIDAILGAGAGKALTSAQQARIAFSGAGTEAQKAEVARIKAEVEERRRTQAALPEGARQTLKPQVIQVRRLSPEDSEAYRLGQARRLANIRAGAPDPEATGEITRFKGKKYAFLSNMYRSPVTYEGATYPSVENAFQAAKTQDAALRAKFQNPDLSGYDAKVAGRELDAPADWDTRREDVMTALLRAKFSDPKLRRRLSATSGRTLTEGNTWGDTTWGVDERTGQGQNMLGKMLMAERDGRPWNRTLKSSGVTRDRYGLRFPTAGAPLALPAPLSRPYSQAEVAAAIVRSRPAPAPKQIATPTPEQAHLNRWKDRQALANKDLILRDEPVERSEMRAPLLSRPRPRSWTREFELPAIQAPRTPRSKVLGPTYTTVARVAAHAAAKRMAELKGLMAEAEAATNEWRQSRTGFGGPVARNGARRPQTRTTRNSTRKPSEAPEFLYDDTEVKNLGSAAKVTPQSLGQAAQSAGLTPAQVGALASIARGHTLGSVVNGKTPLNLNPNAAPTVAAHNNNAKALALTAQAVQNLQNKLVPPTARIVTPQQAQPAGMSPELFTPKRSLVFDNNWINPSTWNNRAAYGNYDSFLESERTRALSDQSNREARRAATVGQNVRETLNADDYYDAEARGQRRSAQQAREVGRDHTQVTENEARDLLSKLLGHTDTRGLRTPNGRGITHENAFTAVTGRSLTGSFTGMDKAALQEAARYADLMVKTPAAAGSILREAQAKLRAMGVSSNSTQPDLVGQAQDRASQQRANLGLNVTSGQRRAEMGMNATNNDYTRQQSLAGMLRMTPGQLTDTSGGMSRLGIMQQGSGLSTAKLFDLEPEALGKIATSANAAHAALGQFGAGSVQFKEAMDDVRDSSIEARRESEGVRGRTSESSDRARRYKDEVNRQLYQHDRQGNIAINAQTGERVQTPWSQRTLARLTQENPNASEAQLQTLLRERAADTVTTRNRRLGMVNAGLVNMGAFLGGSLLQSGLTAVGTQMTDSATAQRTLQRVFEVQRGGEVRNVLSPQFTRDRQEAQTQEAWKMVKGYSGKLGATQAETADLIGKLSEGGVNSINEVESAVKSLASASRNTGMTLTDMKGAMDAISALHIEPIDAAEFLGDYAGLKNLSTESIQGAATKIKSSSDANYLSTDRTKDLLLGVAEAGDRFKGFSSNAAVAAEQINRYETRGQTLSEKKAPQLSDVANPFLKWAGSLVDVKVLMERVGKLFINIFETAKPIIGILTAVLSVVLDIVNALLGMYNSNPLSSLVTVIGTLVAAYAMLRNTIIATALAQTAFAKSAIMQSVAGGIMALSTRFAAFGSVVTMAMGAAMKGTLGFGAALTAIGRTALGLMGGPLGLIIGGAVAIGGAVFGKTTADRNAKTEENKRQADNDATYEQVRSVIKGGQIPEYTVVDGAGDRILKGMSFKDMLGAERNKMIDSTARGLLGQNPEAWQAKGLDKESLDEAVSKWAKSENPVQSADAQAIGAAKAQIQKNIDGISAAKVSGQIAYESAVASEHRKYQGSFGQTANLLGGPLASGFGERPTDQKIEYKAAIAQRDAYEAALKKQFGNADRLADTSAPEYIEIAKARRENADRVYNAGMADLQVNSSRMTSEAKVRDDKLAQLAGDRSANEATQRQLRDMIDIEKSADRQGAGTKNLIAMQIELNSKIAERRTIEDQILQARLEQVVATQRFLQLQEEISGKAVNNGLGMSLAGQEAGTQAARGANTPGTDLIQSMIKGLTDPNVKRANYAADRADAGRLGGLIDNINVIDQLKQGQEQKLNTAKGQLDRGELTQAGYKAEVGRINLSSARAIAQAQAAFIKEATAVQSGMTNKKLVSGLIEQIGDPSYATSTGFRSAREAQLGAYDEGTAQVRANIGVNQAAATNRNTLQAVTETVGAPTSYDARRISIEGNFTRALADNARQLTETVANLQREANRPGTNAARKAEIRTQIEQANIDADTRNTEIHARRKDETFGNMSQDWLRKVSVSPLDNGRVTQNVLQKRLGMLSEYIKLAETQADPVSGLTMKQGSVGDYKALVGERMNLNNQLEAMQLAARRAERDYKRQVTSLYGGVTGTVVGAENQGRRLADTISDDTNMSTAQKMRLGLGADGRIIQGSRLDDIVNVSATQNDINQRADQFGQDYKIAGLQAGPDRQYAIDRSGFVDRAKEEYERASRDFDSQRSRFPDMASFEKAKSAALSKALENVRSSEQSMIDWNRAIDSARANISNMTASLMGGSVSNKRQAARDALRDNRGKFAPGSVEDLAMRRNVDLSTSEDALTNSALRKRSVYDTEDSVFAQSRWAIDYKGRAKEAQAELVRQREQFNKRWMPELIAGNISNRDYELLQGQQTRAARENAERAERQSREWDKDTRTGRTNISTFSTELKGGQVSNRTGQALDMIEANRTVFKPGSAEQAEMLENLHWAKSEDALTNSALRLRTRYSAEDSANLRSKWNVDREMRVLETQDQLNNQVQQFTSSNYGKVTSGQMTQEDFDSRLMAYTKAARENNTRAREDRDSTESRELDLKSGVSRLSEELGVGFEEGALTLRVQETLKSLEQSGLFKDDHPIWAQLSEIQSAAEFIDTYSKDIRVVKSAFTAEDVTMGATPWKIDLAARAASYQSTYDSMAADFDAKNAYLLEGSDDDRRTFARRRGMVLSGTATDLRQTNQQIAGRAAEQRGLDESMRGFREMNGQSEAQGGRVKAINDKLFELRNNPAPNIDVQPAIDELEGMLGSAERLDTAEKTYKTDRQNASYAGITSAGAEFDMNAEALQAFVNKIGPAISKNEALRDSVNDATLALVRQADAAKTVTEQMSSAYQAQFRSNALTQSRLAVGVGSPDRNAGWLGEQRVTVQTARNAVSAFDDERPSAKRAFMAAQQDPDELLKFLTTNGSAADRALAAGVAGRLKTSTTTTNGVQNTFKGFNPATTDREQVMEAAWNLRSSNERRGLLDGVQLSVQSAQESLLSRLEESSPDKGTASLFAALTDPESKSTVAQILSRETTGVNSLIQAALTDPDMSGAFTGPGATARSKEVLSGTQTYAANLEGLNTDSGRTALNTIRTGRTEVARLATVRAEYKGEDEVNAAAVAAIDVQIKDVNTRMEEAGKALAGFLPESVVQSLIDTSDTVAQNARAAVQRAQERQSALRSAREGEAAFAFERTMKRGGGIADINTYYAGLRGTRSAEIGTLLDNGREQSEATLLARYKGASVAELRKAAPGNLALEADLKAFDLLPTALEASSMSIEDLAKRVSPALLTTISNIRLGIAGLDDKAADERMGVAERSGNAGRALRDAVSGSYSERIDEALARRDWLGAGQQAAGMTLDRRQSLAERYNAKYSTAYTPDEVMTRAARETEFAPGVAEILNGERDMSRRIKSTAFTTSLNDALSEYDRDTERRRPQVSAASGREYDLRVAQNRLTYLKKQDTTGMDTGAIGELNGQIRQTVLQVQQATDKMQTHWQGFWTGLAQDMMGVLKDGLARSISAALDTIFQIEDERTREYKKSSAALGYERQGQENEGSIHQANADRYDRLAKSAKTPEEQKHYLDLRDSSLKERDAAQARARGTGTQQAILDSNLAIDKQGEESIWAQAVNNMKDVFIQKISGEMLDQSLGKLFDSVLGKIAGTQDPQIVATNQLTAASGHLAESVSLAQDAMTQGIGAAGLVYKDAASTMLAAAQTIASAATTMSATTGGDILQGVLDAVPSITGPAFGVKIPPLVGAPAAPSTFGVKIPTPTLGTQALPTDNTFGVKHTPSTLLTAASTDAAVSIGKTDAGTKPLIAPGIGQNLAVSGVTLLANAVTLPSTGNVLGDAAVGYVKSAAVAGLTGLITGGTTAAGAALASSLGGIGIAVAALSTGIMLMNKHNQNQAQMRQFMGDNRYGVSATGVRDSGIPKGKWMQLGGSTDKIDVTPTVNISLIDPLSSAKNQMQIGQSIARKTGVELLRKGVTG